MNDQIGCRRFMIHWQSVCTRDFISLNRLFLLALLLQGLPCLAALTEDPSAKPKPVASISPTQERLNALKAGKHWEYELLENDKTIAFVSMQLLYDAAKRRFEIRQNQYGHWQLRSTVGFSAEPTIKLTHFEMTYPPQRSYLPRKATGEVVQGFLQGIDADGDKYRMPVTNDSLPELGLMFLFYAGGTRQPAYRVQLFDEAVQDLLGAHVFVADGEETIKPDRTSYKCVVYRSEDLTYWLHETEGVVQMLDRRQRRRIEWRILTDVEHASIRKRRAEFVSLPGDPGVLDRALAKPSATGVLVLGLQHLGSGSKAGIQPGDILTKFEQWPVATPEALQKAQSAAEESGRREYELELNRAGERLKIKVEGEPLGLWSIAVESGKPVEAPNQAGKWGSYVKRRGQHPLEFQALRYLDGMNWSEDIEQALIQARQENRPILWWVDFSNQSPEYALDTMHIYHKAALFRHPRLGPFLAEHFVLLKRKWFERYSQRWPLQRVCAPALIVLNPDGSLRQYLNAPSTFNESFYADWFKAALDREEKVFEETLPVFERALGHYDAATAAKILERLPKEPGFQRLYNEGRLLRLQGQLAQAMNSQTQALRLAPEIWRERIRLELGLLHLRKRKFREALAYLNPDDEVPRGAHFLESLYYRGAAHLFMQNEEEALRSWLQAAEGRDSDAWACLSALEASGLGPLSRGFEQLHDLPKFMKISQPVTQTSVMEALPVNDAIDHALQYLLERQRSNGSWSDSNYTFGNELGNNPQGVDSLPNVHFAVTALATHALLKYRSRQSEACAAALQRAWRYLLDERNIEWRDKNELIFAVLYGLEAFAAGLPQADEALSRALSQRLEKYTDYLFRKAQDKDGLWGHEYPNGFVTGSVLLGVTGMRDYAARKYSGRIQQALQRLKLTRSDRGTWPYYPQPGSWPLAWKGSAGRSVNAEAALMAWGEGVQVHLVQAMERYLQWGFVEERVRKHTYHSDAYGVGGFYYWYNTRGFADGLRLLHPDAARPLAQRLEHRILKTQELDGSFVDSFQLGKSYATAMALLSLQITESLTRARE